MTDPLESLITYCTEADRVCPRSDRWNELWEMLPDRHRKGAGWEPSLPLILSAWWYSSNLDKHLRLREHVEWAASHGCLPEIDAFLRRLPENEWHHLGD